MTARLTADAKLFTVKNDKQVVNFNVAINDSYKPKGSSEVKKIVTYVQCAYWMHPGIAKFLTKGTVVEMQGRIGVNAYKNMDGEARASLQFHVNSIKFHGGSKPMATTTAPKTANEANDDLPF